MSNMLNYLRLNRGWPLVVIALLVGLVAGCGSDDPTAPVSPGPGADFYVRAGTGNDGNAGSASAPFKTISYALSMAAAGDTIQVLPGTYDVANGEVFPLQMPDSVTLLGDVTNAGANGDTTLIKGSGTANPSYTACLVGANGATVAGFLFTANSSIALDFGVFCDSVDFTVASCRFHGMYGGVRLQGLGNPVVTTSIFETVSYGVYDFCLGNSTISGNSFVTASLSVDIHSTGDITVSGNTFTADGLLGIQIQSGDPVITDNVFEGDYGANYGAVRAQFSSEAILRGNVFNCATSPCVRVGSAGNIDIGTVGAPGGNVFGGASGVAIQHDGADTVFAAGNTWHVATPVCGSHIVVTGSGTVIWGSDPAEQCP